MAEATEKKIVKFNPQVINKTGEYFVGLDVGTNSVGWAVTDTQYNVVKKNGKGLWGSRLFREGETAATRRGFRSARRRRKRAKNRIKFLQEYFAEAINEIDSGFYRRLKDSFFYPEDKNVAQQYTLFNDKDFTDVDYHKKYPTIYHLRKELMENSKAHDPRLVYLACHHIMKHRGNFLHEGKSIESGSVLHDAVDSVYNQYKELFGKHLFPIDVLEAVIAVLVTDDNASSRMRELNKLLNTEKIELNNDDGEIEVDDSLDLTKIAKEFTKLLVGNKTHLDKLFPNLFTEDEDTQDKDLSISFKNDADEVIEEKLLLLPQEQQDLFSAAQSVYNSVILQKLLSDDAGNTFSTISDARIATYNKHDVDLQRLKDAVIKIDDKSGNLTGKKRLYHKIFRANSKSEQNYVAYSGKISDDESSSPEKRVDYEGFAKYIKKHLKNYEDVEDVTEIIDELDKETFLPKISSSKNGVVPFQLHLTELKQILNNAKSYVNGLNEQVVEDIIKIFEFRIPYYIGPFDTRSDFSWIKRKPGHENTLVTPLNFNEVVDSDGSANAFIRRMTNKCTYLFGEDVLAKDSLLYSEYMVRNALNMLTYDGKRLSHDTLKYLYDTLFIKNTSSRKVTKKTIAKALADSGMGDANPDLVGGMDIEIPARLKSLQDFNRIVGDKLTRVQVEDVVETITVFPDDTKMIRKRIKDSYGHLLSEEEIKSLAQLKYKDWGRFSKKFLNGVLTGEIINGKRYTIIEILRENPLNSNEPLILMEILNMKEFGFQDVITEENTVDEDPTVVTDVDLDNLRLSPAINKSIIQTLKIIKEITGIMGSAPKKIFIEMARGGGEQGRTSSRKTMLSKLYSNIKEDVRVWNEELKDKEESEFNSKKLYLYALQRGKDMYTGKPIDINELNNDTKYQIDHIYPRSLTKDDSFNNLVLVSQAGNVKKANKLLYEVDNGAVVKTQEPFWRSLLDQGFMTLDKYNRLTRRDQFSTDELRGFVNRQLVETRQSTKVIKDLLTRIFENNNETRIVTPKASLTSDFRYNEGTKQGAKFKFYFPKVRDINSLHHAKDAYLNIVTGNVYDAKFTERFWRRVDSGDAKVSGLLNMYDRNVTDRHGELAWITGEQGTIATVKKMMNRNNIMVTYQTRRQGGGFYDQMLVKKGKGQYPIKSSVERLQNFDKYGGFNKVQNSHFCVAKYKEKNKEKVSILGVPNLLEHLDYSDESIIEYYASQGFTDMEIMYSEIKVNSMIELDGIMYRLRAKHDATRLRLAIPQIGTYSNEIMNIIKEVERLSAGKSTEISNEELIYLFDYLSNKLSLITFSKYNNVNLIVSKMINKKEVFKTLEIVDKASLLISIAKLINGSGDSIDLALIKESKNSGIMAISTDITKRSSLDIINKSITGFYESRVKVF